MRTLRPRAPSSLEETGLDIGILGPLTLKNLYSSSNSSESAIAERLGLTLSVTAEVLQFLLREHLCEVTGGQSQKIGGSRYALTSKGLDRATTALSTGGYVGRAPVPLEDYVAQVRQQSVFDVAFDRQAIEVALSHLVLPAETRDLIGQAVSSKRSTLVYGASGNGKTSAALSLKKALPGQIIIPYAVEFMREVIQLFDSSAHEIIAEENRRSDERGTALDQRWAVIKRPVVLVEGELLASQLELMLDDVHKTYDAPVQMKANGGLFIIDDFGRQPLDAAYLLNRWVTPLERQIDYLSIHSGARLEVPFDVIPLFVSNRPPAELADEAFLRRIRYKVEIPSPNRERFTEILRRECDRYGVGFDDQAADYLLNRFYSDGSREMRGCHPRDLVEIISDAASYQGEDKALTEATIDRAGTRYFSDVP